MIYSVLDFCSLFKSLALGVGCLSELLYPWLWIREHFSLHWFFFGFQQDGKSQESCFLTRSVYSISTSIKVPVLVYIFLKLWNECLSISLGSPLSYSDLETAMSAGWGQGHEEVKEGPEEKEARGRQLRSRWFQHPWVNSYYVLSGMTGHCNLHRCRQLRLWKLAPK